MPSNYPATSYPEGVDLTIIAGNQLHQVINGDADKVISTDGGDIPSVRKALADIGAFKPPINWVSGAAEEDPFQVRLFTDGSYYWAPSATNKDTIPMGDTPIGDPNWKLAPLASNDTVSNTNLLSNHNFLVSSPDSGVTPPSESTTAYPAGTQVFSGWYAGASGVSLKKENSLITIISGSLYQDVPRNNGLELVTNFIASVSDFQGTPTVSNVSHSIEASNFRVTVSDGAVDVGSVKFEQGKVPTQHEVKVIKDTSEVSILDCGMSGNPDIDESDLFIDALSKNPNLYIPKGKTVKITKPIPLFCNTLRVDGLIDQYHDGIGLHVMYGSKLIGGVDAYHMRRMSPSFSSDLACCVLLYRNDSGGCIENKVDDFVVINGFIDFSSDPQGKLDPAKCEGKAFWLLAGDTHGLSTKNANEHTYRNHFTNCRADGFEYDLILEADAASINGKNGWVNGNTFVNFSSRRCKHQIYITCPLEDKDGKLLGECSGNFFKNLDIQFGTDFFVESIYCEGRNNVFELMQWDTPEDRFPIVKFDKRDKSLAYGFSSPSGNVVHITGSSATLENRGVYEVDSGFNTVINSSKKYDNIFPVSPLGSGQREDQSYIGVVENFLGLGDMVTNLQFEKLDASESVIGNITPVNQDRMFNPEQESFGSVPITTDTYGVNIKVTMNGSNNHVAYAGLVLAYKEFVSGTVDFDFYDSGNNKLATVYSDLTRDSSINTGKQNITGVKWFRIKIRVPQTGSLTGNIDINNLFCKIYNRRNDRYHCRRDQDEVIKGDYTFNGATLFNAKPKFGSGAEFFGDMECLDNSKGFIMKSSNGTRYRLQVNNDGTLKTTAV